MPEDWESGGFGLYIHWPFCQAKCPYCDFNSHVSKDIDQNRWNRAYLGEVRRIGRATRGRVLKTVYFGGGTPSLMSPDTVSDILSEIKKTWAVSNSFEVTLEANPTSAEIGKFRGFRDAGINRLSMGFQAMNDTDLRRLGRMHSVKEAYAAFDMARNTFDRISFDLIYARQDQSLSDWKSELSEALMLSVDHLSLYQLTIEDGTAFGDRHLRGLLAGIPGEGLATDMYFTTQELCDAVNMPAYEVSNHARDGSESRHNLIYWRGGDYAGIGPGAHGRLTLGGERLAIDTPLMPNDWLGQVEETGSGDATSAPIPAIEQATEYLMMGLRVKDGISTTRFEKLLGKSLDQSIIREISELGLISFNGETLAVTDKGRPLLNAILRELAP